MYKKLTVALICGVTTVLLLAAADQGGGSGRSSGVMERLARERAAAAQRQVVGALTTQPLAVDAALTLTVSGARFGDLAPCECKSKQSGGIDRESTLLRRFQRDGVPQLRVDAGGYVAPIFDSHEELKGKFILKAMRLLDVKFANVGWTDILLGADELRSHKGIEFLSCNILDAETSKPLFQPVRRVTVDGASVLLVGVTQRFPLDAFDDNHHYHDRLQGKIVFADPVASARAALRENRRPTDAVILLLFCDPSEAGQLIEAMPPVDLTLNGFHHLANPEVHTYGDQRMLTAGYRGRFFWEVALGAGPAADATGKTVIRRVTPVDVPSDSPRDPKLTALLDEYSSTTKKLYSGDNPIALPRQDIVDEADLRNRFVGARMCVACHEQEHTEWSQTPHAHAMDTLVAKGREYDPDCVGCHSVAYLEGGHFNLERTPHLVGVQCENCHGPGYLHTREWQTRNMKLMIAAQKGEVAELGEPEHPMENTFTADLCLECHDAENDDDFDFARDLPLVSHKGLGRSNSKYAPKEKTAPNAQ